jgi:hypothetical protein
MFFTQRLPPTQFTNSTFTPRFWKKPSDSAMYKGRESMVSDTPMRKGAAWAAQDNNKKLKKSAIRSIQTLDDQRIPKKCRGFVTSESYQEETQKAISSGH